MISKGHIDQAENFFTSWIAYWEDNFIDDVKSLYKKIRTDFEEDDIVSVSALNIHKEAKKYYNGLKEISLKEEDVISWDIKNHLIKEFNRQTTYFNNLKTETNEMIPCVRVRDSEIDIGLGKISTIQTVDAKLIQIPSSDNSSTMICLNSLKEIISNGGLVTGNTDIYLPFVLGRCYFLRFLHAKLTLLLDVDDYDKKALEYGVLNFLKSHNGAVTGKYIFATSKNPNSATFKEYALITGHSFNSIKGGYYRAKQFQDFYDHPVEHKRAFWNILSEVLSKVKIKKLTTK